MGHEGYSNRNPGFFSRVKNDFVCFSRPSSYWDVVCLHGPAAFVSFIIMTPVFTGFFKLLPLKTCTFLDFFGYPCPFCGFSRSFRALYAGDLNYALVNCPLSIPLYSMFMLLLIWNVIGLVLGLRVTPGRHLKNRLCISDLIMGTGIAVVLNWGYRLMMGFR